MSLGERVGLQVADDIEARRLERGVRVLNVRQAVEEVRHRVGGLRPEDLVEVHEQVDGCHLEGRDELALDALHDLREPDVRRVPHGNLARLAHPVVHFLKLALHALHDLDNAGVDVVLPLELDVELLEQLALEVAVDVQVLPRTVVDGAVDGVADALGNGLSHAVANRPRAGGRVRHQLDEEVVRVHAHGGAREATALELPGQTVAVPRPRHLVDQGEDLGLLRRGEGDHPRVAVDLLGDLAGVDARQDELVAHGLPDDGETLLGNDAARGDADQLHRGELPARVLGGDVRDGVGHRVDHVDLLGALGDLQRTAGLDPRGLGASRLRALTNGTPLSSADALCCGVLDVDRPGPVDHLRDDTSHRVADGDVGAKHRVELHHRERGALVDAARPQVEPLEHREHLVHLRGQGRAGHLRGEVLLEELLELPLPFCRQDDAVGGRVDGVLEVLEERVRPEVAAQSAHDLGVLAHEAGEAAVVDHVQDVDERAAGNLVGRRLQRHLSLAGDVAVDHVRVELDARKAGTVLSHVRRVRAGGVGSRCGHRTLGRVAGAEHGHRVDVVLGRPAHHAPDDGRRGDLRVSEGRLLDDELPRAVVAVTDGEGDLRVRRRIALPVEGQRARLRVLCGLHDLATVVLQRVLERARGDVVLAEEAVEAQVVADLEERHAVAQARRVEDAVGNDVVGRVL